MTYDELVSKILEIMPNASLDEDNEGQIIVYTNMRLTPHNNLVEFEAWED